ncbi:MAG: glycosyltransferase family A protein, partial [bacterium]
MDSSRAPSVHIPSVSIVVPAHNAARTIGDCIQSLRDQRGLERAPEIIIVDDGSTDRTPEIVGNYSDARLIRQENLGPGAARNTGIAQATGDYILVTDSDCTPSPDWAAELLRDFASPTVALVMGKTESGESGGSVWAKVFMGRDLVGRVAGSTSRFNSNNMAVRRELAVAFPFDSALGIY